MGPSIHIESPEYEIRMEILRALERVMEEVPFDRVTVTQICAEAGISRATFYRRFPDKFAIPQWHVGLAYSMGASKIGRTLSWREGYYVTEAMVSELSGFYEQVAKSHDYNSIDSFAPRYRKETLVETLTKHHGRMLTRRLEFEIDAVVDMETHVFPRWHYGHYQASLDEVCEWMCDAIPRRIFSILDVPANAAHRDLTAHSA